jgi:hypothetical protein
MALDLGQDELEQLHEDYFFEGLINHLGEDF